MLRLSLPGRSQAGLFTAVVSAICPWFTMLNENRVNRARRA